MISQAKMARAGPAKSRVEKTKPVVVQPPVVTHEIVAGKFNDSDWNLMLDRDAAVDFILEILDEILANTQVVIYDKYMEKQLLPFTVTLAKDALLQIIEWRFLVYDDGEISHSSFPDLFGMKTDHSSIPDVCGMKDNDDWIKNADWGMENKIAKLEHGLQYEYPLSDKNSVTTVESFAPRPASENKPTQIRIEKHPSSFQLKDNMSATSHLTVKTTRDIAADAEPPPSEPYMLQENKETMKQDLTDEKQKDKWQLQAEVMTAKLQDLLQQMTHDDEVDSFKYFYDQHAEIFPQQQKEISVTGKSVQHSPLSEHHRRLFVAKVSDPSLTVINEIPAAVQEKEAFETAVQICEDAVEVCKKEFVSKDDDDDDNIHLDFGIGALCDRHYLGASPYSFEPSLGTPCPSPMSSRIGGPDDQPDSSASKPDPLGNARDEIDAVNRCNEPLQDDCSCESLPSTKWQFLVNDSGESLVKHDTGWLEDEEPEPAVTDCWAQGCVPRVMTCAYPVVDSKKEKVEQVKEMEKIPEIQSSLDDEMVDRVSETEETRYPGETIATPQLPQDLLLVDLPCMQQQKKPKGARFVRACPEISCDETEREGVTPVGKPGPKLVFQSVSGKATSTEIDAEGNLISAARINPDHLPVHRVKVNYSVLDPSHETATTKAEALKKNKLLQPTRSSIAAPSPKLKQSVIAQKRDSQFPDSTITALPPPLLESMDVAPGVTVKEGDFIRRGPEKYYQRQRNLSDYQINLRPIANRIHVPSIDVSDLLDRETPILRPLLDSSPLPPIRSHHSNRPQVS